MSYARHGWRKNAKDTSVVAIGERRHKVLKCEHVTKADDKVSRRHEMNDITGITDANKAAKKLFRRLYTEEEERLGRSLSGGKTSIRPGLEDQSKLQDQTSIDVGKWSQVRDLNNWAMKALNVNARVFTNQMWTNGRRTKTNPKTSPEQSEINKTNAKNVTSKVKTAPTPWRPYIYKTNLFTKFHDDWANNVTSRVFTSFFLLYKYNHVIQLTGTIFKLNSNIKETNVLTKFHENWAKNVTSRIWTIFEPVRDINKTNVLTNFHDDWAKIVTSRVFTRKTDPPTGGHVFQRTRTTFELNQHIIKANLLTNVYKFHEDRTINVASRVFTNKCGRMDDGQRPVTKAHLSNQFHEDWTINVASIEKNAPPLGSNVFQAKFTSFELIQDIIWTNLLSNLYEDRKMNVASRVLTRKNAPPRGGHVFQPTGIIFELVQDIIGMNLPTKFHEDQTINDKCGKNAPPLGSQTNLLTKLTRQMLTPHNRQQTDKRRSQKLTMSTLCSEKCDRQTDSQTDAQSANHKSPR
ncbi:hypothetical protein DPMN_104900 [Dreissena polymorpha]|uniref:Uncharacterized protein n=1 Tax=Dreissena polymorpha TaxID=45954 RepID=A0A9D4HCC5_DREPO|nr:hypothetical protein DPMN_104900 [Dreissena polymorpha]